MLEAFGISDPGCVRTNNEDYYLLDPALDLYLVADGMGGALAGEHASKLAVETVAECLRHAGPPRDEILLDALAEANRRVLAEAAADPAFHGMGTTMTAAWRADNELLLANVGDSRAYVWLDGQLHVITEDQTWVNEVGRRLGIGEAQLKIHPMRHVLTMAIGVTDCLRVHSYAVPLQPGSQFLLCSDGLHGVVDAEQIAATLAGDGSLASKAAALVESARRSGGPDNITAILMAVVGNR